MQACRDAQALQRARRVVGERRGGEARLLVGAAILTLVLLWYFGRDLENQVGRRPMMSLYVALWAILTVVAFVVAMLAGSIVPMPSEAVRTMTWEEGIIAGVSCPGGLVSAVQV